MTNLFPRLQYNSETKIRQKLDTLTQWLQTLLKKSEVSNDKFSFVLRKVRVVTLVNGLGHHWCYPLKNAHHQQEIIFMPLASQGFEGHFNAFQRLHQKAIHKSFASVSQEYCYKKKAKRETCNFFFYYFVSLLGPKGVLWLFCHSDRIREKGWLTQNIAAAVQGLFIPSQCLENFFSRSF